MASMMKLYKLDKDKIHIATYLTETDSNVVDPESASFEDFVHAIIYRHNKEVENQISYSSEYKAVDTGHEQEMGGATFITYHAVSGGSHSWNKEFTEPLSLAPPRFENVASFFEVDGEIFAINSGHGINLFSRYVDSSFPIHVAQRIMQPNPTSAQERVVAGNVFGRTQSFRRQQAISASRNISSVWQSLGGKLTEEVIIETNFSELFTRKTKEVNAEFSGCVYIRKSLDFANLPKLAKWLLDKSDTELTDAQKVSFAYLNCLEKLNIAREKDLIRRINIEYTKHLLSIKNTELESVDFAHHDYQAFLAAGAFKIAGAGGRSIEISSDEVYASGNGAKCILQKLSEYISEIIGSEEYDDEGVFEIVKEISISTIPTDEDAMSISSNALKYFQGEFTYDRRKYFRIDGDWYRATDGFLETVNREFGELLGEKYFTDIQDILIIPSARGEKNEGKYNQGYNTHESTRGSHFVTDKVSVDNIELADVIGFKDGKVYIYHDKYDFGASMRDVCSQLSLSMSMFNRILDSKEAGKEILNRYYSNLEKKYNSGEYSGLTLSISREDFINKILATKASDFVFVLGCIDDKDIDASRGSNIAKFEAIGITKVEAPEYDFNLRIVRIESE